MAVNQGKRPSPRVQASRQQSAIGSQPKTAISTRRSVVSRTKPNLKNSSRRRKRLKPKWPVSVVTREGKTTTRQLKGRRFVRFGEFRGKRVARLEFYTCSPNYHSISVYFQDRTVLYLKITPMFTVKPDYYRLEAGDLEIIKEWPEMKIER